MSIIEPKKSEPTKIPDEKIVERPWGRYRMFAENVKCTAKILYIRRNEKLSMQFHRLRDQIYYLFDEFAIWLSDTEVPEDIRDDVTSVQVWAEEHVHRHEGKPGDLIKIPRFVIHRPCYEGEKAEGILLDMAFRYNDEADIVRIQDLYGRT